VIPPGDASRRPLRFPLATVLAATYQGGVAYLAHIGGFIIGMIAARLFENKQCVDQQKWMDQ
jgi:membrane associated rhomboid family serine protease